ncbi:MAG: FMN-binding negative transcriptional regulator [Polyangiales bacterium]
MSSHTAEGSPMEGVGATRDIAPTTIHRAVARGAVYSEGMSYGDVFRVTERDALWALVEAHPLACLVVVDGAEPVIAHAPLILRGDSLEGHVARGNPLAPYAVAGAAVTALFQGPDAYVSPRWYARPREQVPTWNYAVVRAWGRLSAMDGDEARSHLDALAQRFEGEGAGTDAWRASWLDAEALAAMGRGVVAFRVEVDRVEGRFKLSQNRDEGDRRRVESALIARGARGDEDVAALMRAAALGPSRRSRP